LRRVLRVRGVRFTAGPSLEGSFAEFWARRSSRTSIRFGTSVFSYRRFAILGHQRSDVHALHSGLLPPFREGPAQPHLNAYRVDIGTRDSGQGVAEGSSVEVGSALMSHGVGVPAGVGQSAGLTAAAPMSSWMKR
jgi:hypothetical protein